MLTYFDSTAWLVAKPDKCPVRFLAGFHFGGYGVNRDLVELVPSFACDCGPWA
jgi:hypothetical protein